MANRMVHLSTKFLIKEENGQIKNKIYPQLYIEMVCK